MNRKGLGFNLGGKGLPGVSPASLPLRCSGLAELRVEGNAEAQSGGVCWAGVGGFPSGFCHPAVASAASRQPLCLAQPWGQHNVGGPHVFRTRGGRNVGVGPAV